MDPYNEDYEYTAINKKKEQSLEMSMAEASLMVDYPEKVLLIKNKMDIYEKDKESFIKG